MIVEMSIFGISVFFISIVFFVYFGLKILLETKSLIKYSVFFIMAIILSFEFNAEIFGYSEFFIYMKILHFILFAILVFLILEFRRWFK